MVREQQAGRARGLRGKAEAARGERRLDLDRGERGDQRAALQPFFQGPGGGFGIVRLDDEEQRWIEAVSEKPRSIGAPPFARGLPGEAPQHEVAVLYPSDRRFGDNGKGEAKCRRTVAISMGPQLMQPAALELIQGKLPSPKRGRAGVGVDSLLGDKTPTRRWPLFIATPPLARGGRDLRRGRKKADGAGRGRARCGGIGQRHGNLLERANLRAQLLNQDPTPSPACLSNASRRNEDTCCTAWNVVTHATDPQTLVPGLFLERVGT